MSPNLDSMRAGMRLDTLQSEINLLEEYLKVMEDFFENRAAAEQQRQRLLVEERSRRTREAISAGKRVGLVERDTALRDQLGVEEWELSGHLAGILRSSFFISLYSFLESSLDQECRVRKTDNILLSLEDITRKGVIRASIYWEKVLRLPFPKDSYWGDIHVGYRLLRNCIVHNDSKLNQDFQPGFKHLERFINQRNYKRLLSIQDEEIVLGKGFCEKAVETVRKFFEALFAIR